jgi:type I restriction enzyme R subunit
MEWHRLYNFEFLSVPDPKLAKLGALAELYFRDDPPTCLFKVRQRSEQVAKLIAAHHAVARMMGR